MHTIEIHNDYDGLEEFQILIDAWPWNDISFDDWIETLGGKVIRRETSGINSIQFPEKHYLAFKLKYS
jgi:hypothetical protein